MRELEKGNGKKKSGKPRRCNVLSKESQKKQAFIKEEEEEEKEDQVEEVGEHGRAGFQHQRKVALRAHICDNTVPMWGK